MKQKRFVILTIVALMVFISAIYCSQVWAQVQKDAQEAPNPEAKHPVPVEFSTGPNDVDQAAALDPLQVLHTQPPVNGGSAIPKNTFDFGTTGEVDALANVGDALFGTLINNTVNLLVSFQGDPVIQGKGTSAVWYETPQGQVGVQWTHAQLDASGTILTSSREVDALEVWGPPESDDANCYSLVGDPGGISVFYYAAPSGPSYAYISQPTIQAACVALGYNNATTVDLDALMVLDWGGFYDHTWNAGDVIIFSIKSTISSGGNWDGGEIVVLPFSGAPYFLVHGGHTWNTNFQVATTFGVATEEVDAIEAYWPPPTQTPTFTQWGLIILVALLVSSAIFILLKRRKAAVVA
jgi:hypothetical protein